MRIFARRRRFQRNARLTLYKLKLKHNMHNKLTTSIMALLTCTAAAAQKTADVTVANNSDKARKHAPVVIQLDKTDMNVRRAIVTADGVETPCQLDDIDQDGRADELCFMADVEARSARQYTVTLYSTGRPQEYVPQVYAEMLLKNKKIKAENKQDLYISALTVDRGTNPYWQLHHHGAAFENKLVGYRIYFDHRQTVDIYGKYKKGLELKQTQFYPDAGQKAAGYGDDVLWVGSTLGLGTLRGWDGVKPTMLDNVERRSQKIIARGPVRTIIEVKDEGWTPQGAAAPVDMTTLYTLYAGRRECHIAARLEGADESTRLATGFINVKGSTEYSDRHGLRGCWGTDWPVSAKDSVGHKRETVGLGIYIPEEYIASEEPADKHNYAYAVKPIDGKLNYWITFGSDNETFGYHSREEWFCYLSKWKKEMEKPVEVTVRVKDKR